MLTNLCWNHDLFFCNTQFDKANEELITYREPATIHGPPWTSNRYHQIDFIINNQRWKNTCTNCWTDTNTDLDSDHYPVIATFKTTLAKPKKTDHITNTYWNPTQEQIEQYNSTLNKLLNENEENNDIKEFQDKCKK